MVVPRIFTTDILVAPGDRILIIIYSDRANFDMTL